MPEKPARNRSALNRLCRQHLETLGETPVPNLLYSVQLTVWGLENVSLSGELAADADDLDDVVSELLAMPADKAERLLLGATSDDADLAALEADKMALLRAAEDPEQAASWLAEDIFNRLSGL